MTLPVPAPGRFRPLRCGLAEMFLYEAQEFPFHDGRLLLRGDNGSGKSKVLALTLPLLLDANLTPARMEPDADPGKQMAWNLLMGDQHEERTGYSWVEFGRTDEDGQTHIVTLGLGVKAVRQRGVVKHWWFITDQRIGEDLFLIDRLRTVRTRERLSEAIGEHGSVFDTAERYRHAVDEALFGLRGRYAALVELLIHLRQPQLSKRPDEKELNRALTEALPPISEALVDVVAQSYQSLEDEERQVARLRESASAVRTFVHEYTRYAQAVTARATEAPRRAQSEYEARRRRENAATAAVAEAEAANASAVAAAAAAEQAVIRREAERDVLKERRGSDDLGRLDQARVLAAATSAALADALESAQRADRIHEQATDGLLLADAAVARAESEVKDALTSATELVAQAGISLEFEPAEADALERGGEQETARRTRHVQDLTARVANLSASRAKLVAAREADDRAASDLEREDERMRLAGEVARGAGENWLLGVQEHLSEVDELVGTGLADALSAAAGWVLDPQGRGPIAEWVAQTFSERNGELSAELSASRARAADLSGQIDELDVELTQLRAGRIRRPAAPATRATDRRQRPGAAFFECVDVRETLGAQSAAGLEAALEASGLLDAWVNPDGSADAPNGDTLLRAAPLEGSTLFDLLVPVPTSGIGGAAIEELLRSIALAPDPHVGTVSVSTQGTFALGPLTGSWSKATSEYLGATARDRARLARIVAAEHERAELSTQLAGERTDLAAVEKRRARLSSESAAVPADGDVRGAFHRASAAAETRSHFAQTRERRRAEVDAAVVLVDEAQAAVVEASRDYLLEPDSLDEVRQALRELPASLRTLRRTWAGLDRARAEQRSQVTRLHEAGADRETARIAAAASDQAHTRGAQQLATLEATVGAEARELEAQLARVDSELTASKTELQRSIQAREKASVDFALAERGRDEARNAVEDALAQREKATSQFQAFMATRLPELARPEVELPRADAEWAPDPTVRLARRFWEALEAPDISPEATGRAVDRMLKAFELLQSALSVQGRQAARDTVSETLVVTIQHGATYVTPESLAAELDSELGERERLLTERERAILETHLIDEVGAELQQLVQEAQQQVARINAELTKRPTRSGLRLRIQWESTDNELDREGRRLLQQSAAAWSAQSRAAIGDFLRDRITAVRVADPDGSWYERLATALDYRSWNRFAVQINQNGAWRPASGPASGGERVLAASVPLFAAAASHYASASNPHAPRLILLDEAFAGVDDRSRANYLGLLAEFDLDVVMTSEREWATYPEVPGIAIAQLFRLPGTNAILVEHWTWDGATKKLAEDPGMTAIEAPQRAHDDAMLALDLDV